VEILASCSGSTVNFSNIARMLDVSQPTIKDYFRIAHDTFIWRTLPAYTQNSGKRLIKHPRSYIRDTGLLHHILQISSHRRLLSHPQMGASWEGMVIEEILRSLNAFGINYRAYYFRTSAGAEVDLVLEGKFGLVPIEIKHTHKVSILDSFGVLKILLWILIVPLGWSSIMMKKLVNTTASCLAFRLLKCEKV